MFSVCVKPWLLRNPSYRGSTETKSSPVKWLEAISTFLNTFVDSGLFLFSVHAGVNALVILISQVDQINNLFYGDEGVLKGTLKLVNGILYSFGSFTSEYTNVFFHR